MTNLTRRRFLAIAGAMTCAGLAGPVLAGSAKPYIWRGVALGAGAEIRLHTADRAAAADLVRQCLAEIARLERLFSLHLADSAIVRLNRDGFLDNPDGDFIALMSVAGAVHEATGGVFDPTVQPLWASLAARHAGQQESEPADEAKIGYEGMVFAPGRVAFAHPGMALTLNGIAQGYITDRIAALLSANGVRDTLINIGELRALGGRPDGTAWPVHLYGPDGHIVQLRDRALATSAAAGTTFDDAGTVSHIVDPTSRQPAAIGRRVSVEAPTAVLADALSTAFCLVDEAQAADMARTFTGVRIVG
ncbi:MAG: FAD:protein FMN transferase [Alphaproteobacteria bacterium]